MKDKTVTLVVSDLHIGGGKADPGDDFVDDNSQFCRFLLQQQETEEGRNGEIELIINGDFLEFAQVDPGAYTLGSSQYWCSESESLRKLSIILKGHSDIFKQLNEFQNSGNRVTVLAGNHDVDFYWNGVQRDLQVQAGSVAFELGKEWYTRYGGRLRISHGHMLDPANKFEHWANPRLQAKDGLRLEMCPGTLFMVKFVNWLEKRYPFADNLHPVTKVATVLLNEDKLGLLAVAWMFNRFVARHPALTLGMKNDEKLKLIGQQLQQNIEIDDELVDKLIPLYQQVRGGTLNRESVRENLNTESTIEDFIRDLLQKVPPDAWVPIFDSMKLVKTAAIIRSGRVDYEDLYLKVAREQWAKGAQVVVMGHTHLPQREPEGKHTYFNPGSWTRYAKASQLDSLKLDNLRRQEQFPYELNYVRVEQNDAPDLYAEMITFDGKEP
jgi:UDP-2,3-diacylglucosamine pyrophosphatase LpxH